MMSSGTHAERPDGGKDRITVFCLIVVSLCLVPLLNFVSALFGSDWKLFDEGNIAYTSSLVASGSFPHVDFPYFYSGGFEIILGFAFKVLGSSLLVARFVLGFGFALTVVCVYYLQLQLKIHYIIRTFSSVLGVFFAFALHFYIFPAWPAHLLILAGLIAFNKSLSDSRFNYALIAGLAFGVASSLKQNVGVFAVLAVMVSTALNGAYSLDSHSPRGENPTTGGRRRALEILILASLCILPVLLTYMVLRGSSWGEVTIFLILPIVMVAVVFITGRRSVVQSSGRSRAVFGFFVRILLTVGAGFVIGMAPLLIFYSAKGGLLRFIQESFLVAQSVAIRKGFASAFQEVSANPIPIVVDLALYSSPLLISGLAFTHAIKRREREGPQEDIVSLVNAAVFLAFLYLTLYPLLMRMYVYYLLPLMIVVLAYAFDRFMYTLQKSKRRVFVLATAGIAICAGILIVTPARILKVVTRPQESVADVASPYCGVLMRKEIAADINPVLSYLNTRRSDENIVAYDKYNKAFAFLSNRRTEKDYLQRHMQGWVTDTDISVLLENLRVLRVDIVILGTRYLKGTVGERELLTYLSEDYRITLETTEYMVFQKATKK